MMSVLEKIRWQQVIIGKHVVDHKYPKLVQCVAAKTWRQSKNVSSD